MTEPVSDDPLEVLAHCECLLACQASGCRALYEPTLTDPAADPVEAWAHRMATSARRDGWAANSSGLVLCPLHSATSYANDA